MSDATMNRVWKCVDMSGGPDACWEWKLKLNNKGLPYFSHKGRKQLAYRVTFQLYHGTTLDKSQLLLHQCDNPTCCNPKHLRIGTHQENMDDMKQRDRHGVPVIVVKAIRRLADAGVIHSEIADRYGLARRTVTDIINKVTHKHDGDG